MSTSISLVGLVLWRIGLCVNNLLEIIQETFVFEFN